MFSLSFSSVTADCTKKSPPFVFPSSLVTYLICSIIFEKMKDYFRLMGFDSSLWKIKIIESKDNCCL